MFIRTTADVYTYRIGSTTRTPYLVSEQLGRSLYDFLKKNIFRRFHRYRKREFTRQLLDSVVCELLYLTLLRVVTCA